MTAGTAQLRTIQLTTHSDLALEYGSITATFPTTYGMKIFPLSQHRCPHHSSYRLVPHQPTISTSIQPCSQSRMRFLSAVKRGNTLKGHDVTSPSQLAQPVHCQTRTDRYGTSTCEPHALKTPSKDRIQSQGLEPNFTIPTPYSDKTREFGD